MKEYFPNVKEIKFEGRDSDNPLAFKHYNPDEKVLGKRMEEHLKFCVAYWHTFTYLGADLFGGPVFERTYMGSDDPMKMAEQRLEAAFEFFKKLGVRYFTFHDRDLVPEADSQKETNKRIDKLIPRVKEFQKETGIKLLWGTANTFEPRRYMSGASTSPYPGSFAYAASQVKKALEYSMELDADGFTLWGGREGYQTLLNTDMNRELDHMGMFYRMFVDYKNKIGFKGQLNIEPKPREPTKIQYDFDVENSFAFLQRYGLEKEFKFNIEANHATLANKTFQHELEYAVSNDLLGSVDANRGDLLLGWDTDQFPIDIYENTFAMYLILKSGGFTSGGLNFDSKLRRQSIDQVDLFYAHIGAMDAYARALKIAADIIEDGKLDEFVKERYNQWDEGIGSKIEKGDVGFEELEQYVYEHGEPDIKSERKEYLENLLNEYIH